MSPVRILVFAKAPVPGRVKTRLIPALGAAGAARLARRLLRHTLTQALAADLGPVELCASPPITHPDWADFGPSLGIPDDAESRDSGRANLGPAGARPPARDAAPVISVRPPLPQGLSSVAQALDSPAPSPLVGEGWGEGAAHLSPIISEPLNGTDGWAVSRLETSDQGDGDLGARLARAARRHLGPGGGVLLIGTDCPGLSAQCLREAAAALDDHEATLSRPGTGAMCCWACGPFIPAYLRTCPGARRGSAV